eukprot:6277711-Pyramimonas_sp.AAC.1
MAFRQAVLPGALVGRPRQSRACVASAAVAVGWVSATGVAQRIHWNVIKRGRPLAAGLAPEAEWRRDRGSPLTARVSVATAREFVCRGHRHSGACRGGGGGGAQGLSGPSARPVSRS